MFENVDLEKLSIKGELGMIAGSVRIDAVIAGAEACAHSPTQSANARGLNAQYRKHRECGILRGRCVNEMLMYAYAKCRLNADLVQCVTEPSYSNSPPSLDCFRL
jgi:hypothetical protein